MQANTYVVTVYTHASVNPEQHTDALWTVLADNIEGFGGRGHIEGFDVFVEPVRRWTLMTRKVGSPLSLIAQLIRRTIVKENTNA